MFDYNRYLPLYLREVQELIALGNAADPPARQVYDYTVQKYLNQFIQSADIPTLARWEAIFRMNGSGLDIQERRKRVLIKFYLHAPITVKYLKEAIENMTQAVCEITLDYPRYHMDVSLFQVPDESILDFLLDEIYTLKPANITMAMRQFEERQSQTTLGLGALLSSHTELAALPIQRGGRSSLLRFAAAAGAAQISHIQADVALNAVHRKSRRYFAGGCYALCSEVRIGLSANAVRKGKGRYAAGGGKSIHTELTAEPSGGKAIKRAAARYHMACACAQAVQIQCPAKGGVLYGK